jgi:DNA polymerase I-like protein with 3'-5' exonuclease and polymerase domains
MIPIVFDVETTTTNKGHPFDPRNKLISYAYYIPGSPVSFKYYSDPDFCSSLFIERVGSDCGLVGFNLKFDLHWGFLGGGEAFCSSIPVWDCQLAEFVYSGQKDRLISLDECLARYNLPTKKSVVADYWAQGIDTDQIPVEILKEYNEWDVHTTYLLYEVQQKLLSDKQKKLVLLLGEDLKVLRHIEAAGVKYDREAAKAEVDHIRNRVLEIEDILRSKLPDGAQDVFNWNSGDDLSAFLYGGTRTYHYAVAEETTYKSGAKKGEPYTRNRWYSKDIVYPARFKPLPGTEVAKTAKDPLATTRYYQTDEPTLKQLSTRRKEDRELLSLLQKRSEVSKIAEMLESIEKQFTDKQWKDNLMHGQYNQNVVVTGRLSSSSPNQQNMPAEVDQFLVSRYS